MINKLLYHLFSIASVLMMLYLIPMLFMVLAYSSTARLTSGTPAWLFVLSTLLVCSLSVICHFKKQAGKIVLVFYITSLIFLGQTICASLFRGAHEWLLLNLLFIPLYINAAITHPEWKVKQKSKYLMGFGS